MAHATTMQAASEVRFNRFLAGVYLVMAVGLAVTALVSSWVSTNEDLIRRILYDPWFTFGLFIIQIIIVVTLSAAVMRFSPIVAFLLFLGYAAVTGVTISSIFIYYSKSTIAYTFWVAAGMFLFSSVVGLFIKRDLSGIGMFLLLALMGWMFAWVFTWFLPIVVWLQPGDELHRNLALRRPDGMGHATAKTAFISNGRAARNGGHDCSWRPGALPGLHQPVPAPAARLQKIKEVVYNGTLPVQ